MVNPKVQLPVKAWAAIFIPILFTMFLSLGSLVRAGDTKDIQENRDKLEKIEIQQSKNCQELAALKSKLEGMAQRQEDIKKSVDENNKLTIEVLRKLNK